MTNKITLKIKSQINLRELMSQLVRLGYERVETEVTPGNFQISGGNILVFPVNCTKPVLIELFGTEVDRILEINVEENKIQKKLSEVEFAANQIKLSDGTKIYSKHFLAHEDHGIGQFASLMTKNVEGEEKLYIVINYLNEAKLYLPYENHEKLSLYIGVGHRKPKLSRLGSPVWKKTYQKTYENVIQLAKELLNIYAKREISRRKKWKIDEDWEREVVRTFGYIETDSQRRALDCIFEELESEKPMDRLVCGDVGFGKTEIAIRAMAQAVANGYQAAMLVPTTILTEQHYVTLLKRFEHLPVRINHLSRFVENTRQDQIIEKANKGLVDILVGTHKLLSHNIKFKNLGLVVIDEEQKFGVKDKERLKRLRANVNVLSLTATPIPRTLFMSLSGIRDISEINDPPRGRQKILTEVTKYNKEKVSEYIDREINRNGQVYYLHNRVETIGAKMSGLQKVFPKLKIDVAHGQMPEKKLADTMMKFAAGKIDILVCSTIVENGLDLPSANTLIVDDADRFGLSQLYQIRGRIGRSTKQSYALFMHKDKQITPNAFKRLKAIAENVELGSGFNIALSDLEIRGGGNILGKEQHGSMETVGLVLYSKLLKKAVEKLKTENRI